MIIPPISHTNFKKNYTFETSIGQGLLVRNNQHPNRVYIFPTAFKNRINATMLAKMDAVCAQREKENQGTTLLVKETVFTPIFNVKPFKEDVSSLLARIKRVHDCKQSENDTLSLDYQLKEALAQQDYEAVESLLSQGACESCLLEYLDDLPNFGDPDLYITTFVNLFPIIDARTSEAINFEDKVEACPWDQKIKDQHFDTLCITSLECAVEDINKLRKYFFNIEGILDPTQEEFRKQSPRFLNKALSILKDIHLYPELHDVTIIYSQNQRFLTCSVFLCAFSPFFSKAIQFNLENKKPLIFDFSDKSVYPVAIEEALSLMHGQEVEISSDFVTQFYLAQAIDFLGGTLSSSIFRSHDELLIAGELLAGEEKFIEGLLKHDNPILKKRVVEWAFAESSLPQPNEETLSSIILVDSKFKILLMQFRWLREIHHALDDINAFNGVIENLKRNYFSTSSEMKLIEGRLDQILKSLVRDYPHLVDFQGQEGERTWGTNRALINYRLPNHASVAAQALMPTTSMVRSIIDPDYKFTSFRDELLNALELGKSGRTNFLIPTAERRIVEELLKDDGFGVVPLLSAENKASQFLRQRTLKTWMAQLAQSDPNELVRLKKLFMLFSRVWDLRWYDTTLSIPLLTPGARAYFEIHKAERVGDSMRLLALKGAKADLSYTDLSKVATAENLPLLLSIMKDFPYSRQSEMISQELLQTISQHLVSKKSESKAFLSRFESLAHRVSLLYFSGYDSEVLYEYLFANCINVKRVVINDKYYDVNWVSILNKAFENRRLPELTISYLMAVSPEDIKFVDCFAQTNGFTTFLPDIPAPCVKIINLNRMGFFGIHFSPTTHNLFNTLYSYRDLKDFEIQGYSLSNLRLSLPQKHVTIFRECNFILSSGFGPLPSEPAGSKQEIKVIDCTNFHLSILNLLPIDQLTVIRTPITDWPSIMQHVKNVVIDHKPSMPDDQWLRFKDQIFIDRSLTYTK